MGNPQILDDLRELTKVIQMTSKEYWNAPDFKAGVTKGIIVELLGHSRSEWLLALFKSYPDHLILWFEEEPSINPTAIHQRGVALERIKFVNSKDDFQQPLRLAIESGHYPFIIAPNRFKEIRIFQRLQLLANKSKCTLFFLADKKFSSAWPISLQLEIQSNDETFDVKVHRQKQGISV